MWARAAGTDRPWPTRAEIEAYFLGVLSGTISRDDADRWAARWVARPGPEPDDQPDPAVSEALLRLYGIDLTHGPGQPFLFSDDQVAEWLAEFRAGCGPEADPDRPPVDRG